MGEVRAENGQVLSKSIQLIDKQESILKTLAP